MSLKRYLRLESIKLDVYPSWQQSMVEESDEEVEVKKPRLNDVRQSVTSELAELLYASGNIQNLSKLRTDLFNIEKRNPSAIGCGIAIPHLRCMQSKTCVMGFARYVVGFDFDAPDEQEVRIFIPMTAPPYDDRQYLNIYHNISKAMLDDRLRTDLFNTQDPNEVIRILDSHF